VRDLEEGCLLDSEKQMESKELHCGQGCSDRCNIGKFFVRTTGEKKNRENPNIKEHEPPCMHA
jgi:hypothetical protein